LGAKVCFFFDKSKINGEKRYNTEIKNEVIVLIFIWTL